MIVKKKAPKNNAVKVTFQLPADIAEESVALVGDFNDWDETKDLMKLNKKNGHWSKTLTFEPGMEVQFRYFIDGSQWKNEAEADRYVPNDFGTQNAVLMI